MFLRGEESQRYEDPSILCTCSVPPRVRLVSLRYWIDIEEFEYPHQLLAARVVFCNRLDPGFKMSEFYDYVKSNVNTPYEPR